MANPDKADATNNAIRKLSQTNPSAFNLLYPDPKDRGSVLAVDAFARTQGMSHAEAWNFLNGGQTVANTVYNTPQKVKMGKILGNPDLSPRVRQDMHVMNSTLMARGVDFSTIKDTLENYEDTGTDKVSFADHPRSERMLNNKLEGYVMEGSTASYNPLTNNLEYYNDMGVITTIMDRDKFIGYESKIERIQQYNKEYYYTTAAEKGLDAISSWANTSALVQLRDYDMKRRLEQKSEGKLIKPMDNPQDDPIIDLVNWFVGN